jgi:ATP-dependent Clp protease ATP-binding subunit ClpA
MSKRDEVTSPLREEAFLKAQNVSPETFQSATALTVNKTIDDILQSDVGARGTVIKTMNWAKEQLSRGTTPARMYEVRKDLRDAAQGLLDKEGAAYSLAKRELEQVIRSVDDAIDAAAPGYKDYLDKYAKSSRGIERMEAAQQFRGKVMSTIPDPSNIGEYLISQPSFTRAIRAAAEDTKLSKTQLAVLQRVSQDIDSGVLARATKVPGSDTFKNLSTANIIGGIVGKQMFGEVPPAFAKVVAPMNWLYNGSDDAIRQLLVDAMLDPQLAAKMMRRATQATVEPLSEELKKKALAGGLGTAFGLE